MIEVTSVVNFIIMSLVIFNTYRKGKKYPYLYTVASMFLISNVFAIGIAISGNWTAFCYPYLRIIDGPLKNISYNEKCPDIGTWREPD